jgi:hypothetical protein
VNASLDASCLRLVEFKVSKNSGKIGAVGVVGG